MYIKFVYMGLLKEEAAISNRVALPKCALFFALFLIYAQGARVNTGPSFKQKTDIGKYKDSKSSLGTTLIVSGYANKSKTKSKQSFVFSKSCC